MADMEDLRVWTLPLEEATVCAKLFQEIDPPEWARQEWHCRVSAREFMPGATKIIVVDYTLTEDGRKGHSIPYMVGADGRPPPYMEGIWRELNARLDPHGSVQIDPEGRLPWDDGHPIDEIALYQISCMMYEINSKWESFPTVGDYATVESLCSAQEAIYAMVDQENSHEIANSIDWSRSVIKTEQARIASLEEALNGIYEKAAEAMNTMERHGIKPRMERDVDDGGTWYMQRTSYSPIISQLVSSSPSYSPIGVVDMGIDAIDGEISTRR